MTNTETSAPGSEQSAARERKSERVVVGVDGSEGSLAALRWAVHEAHLRGAPLHAVCAWNFHRSWRDPGLGGMFPLSTAEGVGPVGLTPSLESDTGISAGELGSGEPVASGRTESEAAVENQLEQLVTKVVSEYAAGDSSVLVDVSWEIASGHAAKALLRVARDADTLVVGSRGHGEFAGALLGSISQHVAAHAPCPVVVVPIGR